MSFALGNDNKLTKMRIKRILVSILALGLLATGFTACVSEKQGQAKLAALAKVSRPEAEKTALAKVPGGKVKDAELEKEGGKLIWSFDIGTEGTKDVTEIHVDANTGEVVTVEKESAEHEAAEKAGEKEGGKK